MVDIFNKTETNDKSGCSFAKFTSLKFPESKIFTNEPPTPNKKGLKRYRTAKNQSIDFTGKCSSDLYATAEIKFNNVDKKKINMRNYINSYSKRNFNLKKNSINSKMEESKSDASKSGNNVNIRK